MRMTENPDPANGHTSCRLFSATWLAPRRAIAALGGATLVMAMAIAAGCGGSDEKSAGQSAGHSVSPATASLALSANETAFIDTLQVRTFRYFWDLCNPLTGLAPDRAPSKSFASVAATGFALTAYPIGAERGYVTREEAAARARRTLEFFWAARQDTARAGATGYQGFYYHFLDPETGARFEQVELSTVDTALLLAGALFCQTYFDGPAADEVRIGALTDSLYLRVDWQWASVRPPTIGHGWSPEAGFLPYDWRGYNEAMLMYLLALGSPTHPVAPEAWQAWTAGYQWGASEGEPHFGFAPLFGHQYTLVWYDMKGIRDGVMREKGIDYFENSRRAVMFQYSYAAENPADWVGYGPRLWGLTACDGPVDASIVIDGVTRKFETYWARGASFTGVADDGTVCPSAAAASLPFAPQLVVPTLLAMREDHGEDLFSTYGFLDALNPTFRVDRPVQHGRVVPDKGWYDTDYLGIDQGPILAMIENYRTGLVWQTMRRNPHVVRGLRAAGFSGGWLDSLAVEDQPHD